MRAVEEAYGKCEAVEPVAKKRVAVGVVVAMTLPSAFVARSAFARLVTARLVEVAAWSDVFPVAVTEPAESVPIVAVLERRAVEDARPETWSAVEVALMNVLSVKSVVEARSVLPCSVVNDDDACEMRPLVNVMSPAAVSAMSLRRKRSGMRFEAMVEVAKTLPFASVARSAFAREVMWRFVVVAFVAVRSEKVFCPLQVLESERSVEEAVVPLKQMLFTRRQPPESEMPLANVDVAEVPVMFR